MKRRKENCDHPWYTIRASITGLVCTQCGTTWPPDAANIAWIKALAGVNDLSKQIEQLQAALFEHLDMTSCDVCGQFFPDKPLTIHGIKTEHFSLCRDCLLTGYYRFGAPNSWTPPPAGTTYTATTSLAGSPASMLSGSSRTAW